MPSDVWIGLFHVLRTEKTVKDVITGRLGAYVQVLAPASDRSEFIEAGSAALEELGLRIESVEDVEPFSDRVSKKDPNENIRDLADEAFDNNSVMFSTFHTYVGNGEDDL